MWLTAVSTVSRARFPRAPNNLPPKTGRLRDVRDHGVFVRCFLVEAKDPPRTRHTDTHTVSRTCDGTQGLGNNDSDNGNNNNTVGMKAFD